MELDLRDAVTKLKIRPTGFFSIEHRAPLQLILLALSFQQHAAPTTVPSTSCLRRVAAALTLLHER